MMTVLSWIGLGVVAYCLGYPIERELKRRYQPTPGLAMYLNRAVFVAVLMLLLPIWGLVFPL